MNFNFLNHIEQKIIVSSQELDEKLMLWQQSAEKIVFTNGCFDILHAGHLYYLAQARQLGDRLIIGLNSDQSVKRLKGNHRPINTLRTRLWMLASLEVCDAVVIFEEDTPFELIQKIQPDILVKGGDYHTDNIVGADIVLAKGGKVKVLSFVAGYSTTNIEQKIRSQV
jgi:rfaE bifunctional protein nucleotidyltransferase chain/domain